MKKKIHALLCDLDGVITRTASVHARAWKQLFDEFLKTYAEKNNLTFRAFDTTSDYLQYVDGKPRLEGIHSFLESRNIHLKEGTPEDKAGNETLYGLGTLKNQYFHHLLKEGVTVFPESVEQLKKWKAKGYKMGVVSSSKNCRKVLEAAGLQDLFDVVVDGLVAEEKKLKGKPLPGTYLYGAELLNELPGKVAVAEDAGAGIQAAKKGKFGLAIGIVNENNRRELEKAGADVLITDLGKISWDGNELHYS